ncbi:hypothetical protein [Streptomyces nojiriensis]|uniref:hypothetical protein n=1 Tax=Streptomyces nojiriensis TaxID=66374 RepID=UPI003665DF0A
MPRSAEALWAGTVLWTTARGARLAGTGLSAPNWSGERLLHRLAVADVGLSLEAAGHTVLTEREIRTADAVPGRAAELLADLGVPGIPGGAPRGETSAVTVGTRALHWPDLIVVREDGLRIAVEVELTPKPKASLGRILRTYVQAPRQVLYVPTGPVARLLQGKPGPDGRWVDGVAQDVGLLPAGEPAPGAGGPMLVRPFTADDPGVARQVERHPSRHRGPA